MNLRTIARKNILGNLQRYVAYFLSCVFAVSVFLSSHLLFFTLMSMKTIYMAEALSKRA